MGDIAVCLVGCILPGRRQSWECVGCGLVTCQRAGLNVSPESGLRERGGTQLVNAKNVKEAVKARPSGSGMLVRNSAAPKRIAVKERAKQLAA